MLFNEKPKIVLSIIVLLDILQKTRASLLLLHVPHGELEYILPALLVVHFDFLDHVLWEARGTLLCEQDDR